jgi:hypothetical protein
LESSLRRPLNRKEAKWWYLQAWTAPESVFRGLAVSEGSREANWAFVWMCAIAGFTGVFGFISGFVVGGERPPLSLFIFWAIVMTLGSFVGWLFFMGGSGLASLFGYWGYRSRGRNRLVAAFHVVALTSGVYPIASFLLLFLLSGFMVSRARPFEVTLMFVGVAILVGIYVSALWHRMRYVLYSNK